MGGVGLGAGQVQLSACCCSPPCACKCGRTRLGDVFQVLLVTSLPRSSPDGRTSMVAAIGAPAAAISTLLSTPRACHADGNSNRHTRKQAASTTAMAPPRCCWCADSRSAQGPSALSFSSSSRAPHACGDAAAPPGDGGMAAAAAATAAAAAAAARSRARSSSCRRWASANAASRVLSAAACASSAALSASDTASRSMVTWA